MVEGISQAKGHNTRLAFELLHAQRFKLLALLVSVQEQIDQLVSSVMIDHTTDQPCEIILE